jgi:hypothetical protein
VLMRMQRLKLAAAFIALAIVAPIWITWRWS